MLARCALILLLFGLFGDEGAKQGRAGNALYEQKRYVEAESVYREGLAAHEDTTGAVYAALQNNLGAALHRQERFGEARSAFQRAVRAAPASDARVRALFNAATAAAGAGSLTSALEDYKEALLLDPTHDAARYNYEYLKRQLAKRRSGGRPPPDIEPSPYARRIKKKAEALVARQAYDSAATLMQEGLQEDSTVAAYHDFMRRLDDISEIAQMP